MYKIYKKIGPIELLNILLILLIPLLALTGYFKINNIENPGKAIFKNEVKREQPPYTYPLYISGASNLINGFSSSDNELVEINVYYEVAFYFNTSSNYLKSFDIILSISEEKNDIGIEGYSINYSNPIDTTISVYDIDSIVLYLNAEIPNEEEYDISHELYINTLEGDEYYYDDGLFSSYIGDYAFLEYAYSKSIEIAYSMPQYVFVDSYNTGETIGYLNGYENGQENGYQTGYTEGYDTGVQDTINEGDRFSLAWLEPLFQITTDFLNIEILPGFKLIYFVTIPLFFSLIYMILKLFR